MRPPAGDLETESTGGSWGGGGIANNFMAAVGKQQQTSSEAERQDSRGSMRAAERGGKTER